MTTLCDTSSALQYAAIMNILQSFTLTLSVEQEWFQRGTNNSLQYFSCQIYIYIESNNNIIYIRHETLLCTKNNINNSIFILQIDILVFILISSYGATCSCS